MPDRDDSDNPKGRLLFTDFDLSNKGRPPGVSLDLVSQPKPEPVENELLAKPLQTLDDFLSTMDLSFEADDEVAEAKPAVIEQDEDEEAFLDDGDDDPVVELDAAIPPAPERRKPTPVVQPSDAYDDEEDEPEEKPVANRRKAPVKKLRKRASELDLSSPRRRRRRPGSKTTVRPAQPAEKTQAAPPPAPQESITITPEDFVAEPTQAEQPPRRPAKTESVTDIIPASTEESGSFLDEEVEYMPSSSDAVAVDRDRDADDALLASDEDTIYDDVAEAPEATDELAPMQTMQVRDEDLEDSIEDVLEATTTSFLDEDAEFRDATVTDDVPDEKAYSFADSGAAADDGTVAVGEDDIEDLLDSFPGQMDGSDTTTFTDDLDETDSSDEIFDKEKNEWITAKSSRRFPQEQTQDDAVSAPTLDAESEADIESFLDNMFPEGDDDDADDASTVTDRFRSSDADADREDDIESFLDNMFSQGDSDDADDASTVTDHLPRSDADAEPAENRADTGAAAYDVDEEDIANLLDDMFGDKKETPAQDKADEDDDFDPLLELEEEDFAKAIAADEEKAAAVYNTTDALGLSDLSETAVDDSDEQDELLDGAGITEYLGSYDRDDDDDSNGNEADLLAPDSEIWDLFNPEIPTEEVLPPQESSDDVFSLLDEIDSHDDLLSIVPPDVVPPAEPEPEQQPAAEIPADDVSFTRTTNRYELPDKELSTQSDFSGRLPTSPDSTVVMDKPQYEQLLKDMKQKKPAKTRKHSNRGQDTEDLFSNINLKKEWEERIRKYQEKTKNTREEDADKILSDLDGMSAERSTYPNASETDTNYDFFKNTVDFDPNNPGMSKTASFDPAGQEEDDILSALLEEEKETADKLAAEGELASLLAGLENDKPEIPTKNEAEGEEDYEIEPESVADLNWEEDSQSAPSEGAAEAEPEQEQAEAEQPEIKPYTETSDGTESELDLDSMVSAAGWETGQMAAIAEEPAEEEQAEYKHYGPERTAPDDEDDFQSKVRQSAGHADGDEELEQLVEGLGDADCETPAEPAEEEIAVNPLDVFANMDAFDDFDDDGLDDDMKAMLADGEEDVDGEPGEEGSATAEAGTAAAAPLPAGFKGKVVSLLRFVSEKVGRFLPLGKLKNAWQAIGFRDNWRFYINLVAALIATASAAVIMSYFLWYR